MFATNLNFLIPISLQSPSATLWYFKLSVSNPTKFIVWNANDNDNDSDNDNNNDNDEDNDDKDGNKKDNKDNNNSDNNDNNDNSNENYDKSLAWLRGGYISKQKLSIYQFKFKFKSMSVYFVNCYLLFLPWNRTRILGSKS